MDNDIRAMIPKEDDEDDDGQTHSVDVPAKGDRYIWKSILGDVRMRVTNVLVNGLNPRVVFTCYQGDASWQKTTPFPFLMKIERSDWTDDELGLEEG
jgi:hypothetical protein